jgi:hypothetical protein
VVKLDALQQDELQQEIYAGLKGVWAAYQCNQIGAAHYLFKEYLEPRLEQMKVLKGKSYAFFLNKKPVSAYEKWNTLKWL